MTSLLIPGHKSVIITIFATLPLLSFFNLKLLPFKLELNSPRQYDGNVTVGEYAIKYQ